MPGKGRKHDAEAEIAQLSAGCDRRSFQLKRKRVLTATKLFDEVVEPLHLKLQSLGKTDAIIDAKLRETSGLKRDAKQISKIELQSSLLCGPPNKISPWQAGGGSLGSFWCLGGGAQGQGLGSGTP